MFNPEPVRHHESIDAVLAVFETDMVSNEFRSLFRLEGIEYLWTADGTLIPSIASPFSSPYLYRGQVKRWQPCLPGVFRDLEQVDHPQKLPLLQRARCLADRIRLEEFILALNMHPACGFSREIGLRIYPDALAQHYELATDRIDLTQDHKVAAFFATNAFKSGRWSPIRDGNETGVLYRLRTSLFSQCMPEQLECIGKQALPRPGEQKAYTLTLPLGCDFENLPIEIHTFRHNEAAGQRLNDEFAGGASLFPPDVMAEVAHAIRAETSVPLTVVNKLFGVDQLPAETAVRTWDENRRFFEEHLGIQISERQPIGLSTEQLARASESVENMRHTFLQNVGALAARRVSADKLGK